MSIGATGGANRPPEFSHISSEASQPYNPANYPGEISSLSPYIITTIQ